MHAPQPNFSLFVQLFFLVCMVLPLSYLHPGWHRSPRVRITIYTLLATVSALHLLWMEQNLQAGLLVLPLLPTLLFLCAGMYLATITRAVAVGALHVTAPRTKEQQEPPAEPVKTEETPVQKPLEAEHTPTRRAVLSMASYALPAASLGVSLNAQFGANNLPVLKEFDLHFENLAPELEGLRILQFSDMHLGFNRDLDTLERFLAELRTRPDLIVLTGDIAEKPELLPSCLAMVEAVRPRHGTYACFGNHEFFQGGYEYVRRTYERSSTSLLLNEARIIRVGNAAIEIAGLDDPVTTHFGLRKFMDKFFRDLDRSPSVRHSNGDFRLLLSHRPEGFDPAHERGMDLVLSGHTHGGQIGFSGRSAFQTIWPEAYLWGKYSRGRSHLYTTSGFGHLIRYRAGCPTEAPMIRLRRKTQR